MNQLSLIDFQLNVANRICYINRKSDFLMFTKKKVIDTKIISEFDNCITIKMYPSIKDKYTNYVKNLLIRNDLTCFFRAHSKSQMLCSRTTPKKFCKERIIAYAKPLLTLARSLYSGDIYFNKDRGVKVNLYSLNPYDLYRTIQDVVNFDNMNETIHLDFDPKNIAFSGNSFLILTFCIIRGINGYDKIMGKQLFFPKINEYTDYVIAPQDDSENDLNITIFLSDIVEHGSTSWHQTNEIVLRQFNKVKSGNFINEESSPGRMSITMPIFFKTSEPKKLWANIKKKLGSVYY